MLSVKELNERLYEKAYEEQEDYLSDLKKKSPEDIIETAYRITTRNDILTCLQPDICQLDRAEVEALLKLDYPISAIYDEWQRKDDTYLEQLIDTVFEYSEKLAKENEAAKTDKKKSEYER